MALLYFCALAVFIAKTHAQAYGSGGGGNGGGGTTAQTLDPQPFINSSAILIVDAQVGTMTWARTTPLAYAQKNVIALAKFAKLNNIPLVLTSSLEDQPAQGMLMSELQTIAPTEYANRIKRVGVISAWDDPNFRNAVYATGKKQLVIAAFITDVCTAGVIASARAENFDVWYVVDASGAVTEAAEWSARQRILKTGAYPTSTNGVVAFMVHDWSTAQGQAGLSVLLPVLVPNVTQI